MIAPAVFYCLARPHFEG